MRTYGVCILGIAAASLAGCADPIVSTGQHAGTAESGGTGHEVEGFAIAGEQRTGYILAGDGRPMKITFEVHGGRAIFEGDIDVGPADSIPGTPEPLLRPGGPRYGVVISGSGYRWPSGVVHYAINPNLPNQWRVTNAMAHIQNAVAGVQFVPRTNQSSYVYFTTGTECTSPVGRVGGAQNITLSTACTTGNAIHEIGHALGMHHEQSRCDRDSFITIHWNNILPGKADAFNTRCSGAADMLPYSEGSVMHYPPWAFGINNAITITSKRGLDHLMGQRNGFAQSDRSTINSIYPPYALQNLSVTNSGGSVLLTWSPSNGATHYTITRVAVREFYDWTGASWSTEYPGATTTVTGTSAAGGAYTGESTCVLFDNMYETEYETYWYEARAHFPDAVPGQAYRWPAPIGEC